MKVYKAVRRLVYCEPGMFSSYVDHTLNPNSVVYKIGTKTTPNIKNTPLMGFSSLIRAVSFLKDEDNTIEEIENSFAILRCNAEKSATKVPSIIFASDLMRLEDWQLAEFFSKGFLEGNNIRFRSIPKGTIFCNWITPIEEIPIEKISDLYSQDN